MRALLLTFAVGVMAAGIAFAQNPVPAPAAPAAPAPGTVSPAEVPQGFTYNPENRRDPFVSLIRRGGGDITATGGLRPAGLAGLLTSEVTLRGVIQGQNGWVGMLLGSDQKTYIVRGGDKLLDGVVQSITPTGIVIMQQVNDPLSLEKQREVRKPLRQTSEAQQ
jgi:hypothetical protein